MPHCWCHYTKSNPIDDHSNISSKRLQKQNFKPCMQCGTSHLQTVQENILSHIILAIYSRRACACACACVCVRACIQLRYMWHAFSHWFVVTQVERSLMVRWVVGSILHGVDPLSYFSFQPVLHNWCNKGRGVCCPVCGMVHIKEPLLLIDKSSLCGGSGFPFALSEWSLTICLTTYKRR